MTEATEDNYNYVTGVVLHMRVSVKRNTQHLQTKSVLYK